MTTTTQPPRLSAPPPERPASPAGYVLLLVFGTLLGLAGLVLASVAAASAWAMVQQRNGQFLTTPTERYAVGSHALTTTELRVLIDDQLPANRFQATQLMIRVAAADPTQPVFVGIGASDQVTAYLAGVEHTELTNVQFAPFRPTYRTVPGTRTPDRPARQTFWAAFEEGSGTQELVTSLQSGNWMVVVMNADGSSSVSVDLTAGARTALLGPITIGSVAGALILLAAGVALLVWGGSGLARSTTGSSPTAMGRSDLTAATPAAPYHSPVRLRGDPEPLSRWLWLVKWFLAIPHFLILLVLWPVTVVVILIAAVAILITGRYPRPLFDFAVGVLRWSWRVGFYAYSALGTDRYPPFTLSRVEYPADLDVEYPEHLSRGLVLVKSWLLAIPHLIIVGLLTTPWYWLADTRATSSYQQSAGISLLGLLILVAGIALLFTGRYPRPLFDLVLGINRWVYRVLAYVALMRDEYPPFRFDQGPREPDEAPEAVSPTALDDSHPRGGGETTGNDRG